MDDASRLIEMLHAELLPALGCTKPIAVALAAAKARSVLGCEPSSVSIIVSGNIFKNARAVTIPHSGGRHGIPMAAALGVVAGDPEAGLECLAGVTDRDIEALPTGPSASSSPWPRTAPASTCAPMWQLLRQPADRTLGPPLPN